MRAASLYDESIALRVKGELPKAIPPARQALEIYKRVLGERHPDYAAGLNNLAALHSEMGDYRAAMSSSKQALALREAALGQGHPEYVDSLNNLGLLLMAMGDHKAALPRLKGALRVRKEALGRKHPEYIASLNNLASLHCSMGDHGAALRLFREVLACARDVLGPRHPQYAGGLGNLAFVYSEMGDHKAALPLYERVLAIRKDVLGVKHPDYAATLNNLAMAHFRSGGHEAALPLFKKALSLQRELLGERHPDHAASLNNLAFLHRAMGDHEAALPLAERSLALTMAHLRDTAAVQSDRQQLASAAASRPRLALRLSLPDGPGHLPAAAHALVWKGAVLLRQQQRRLFLRLQKDPRSREAAGRLQSVTRRLAALRLSPSATKGRMEGLEQEQGDAQADLAILSESFRAERDKQRVTPEGLAKALPEGVALVDYLFHGGWLSAFVHRKGRPHARIPLGQAAPVGKAVHETRALLAGGREGGMPAAALKRLVWLPLERHLEGVKVVLVSPDGVLGTMPFAALPGKKAGSYLIEDLAVAVVPVPSAIPEMMERVDEKDRLKPSLLVVGDLRYESEEGKATPPPGQDTRSAPRTDREKFPDLPATRAEMLAVRGSFEKLFKGGEVTALTEGDATKAAAGKALAKVRYAHLATHGYFAPEEVKSALETGKGRLGEQREVTGWHPLLLSGLALSDANRAPKPGEEDGILTALEVSEMDLSKLELAVLSACETGLGKVAGGEGILGMQRAFQIAGARTVIASLWKVDDRATRDLMSDFYAIAWDKKKIVSRAEALRQAQLNMLREGRRRGVGHKAEKVEVGKGARLPPYYWAAFVLSGDWR